MLFLPGRPDRRCLCLGRNETGGKESPSDFMISLLFVTGNGFPSPVNPVSARVRIIDSIWKRIYDGREGCCKILPLVCGGCVSFALPQTGCIAKEKSRIMMMRKRGFILLLAVMLLVCGCSASADRVELPHDLKIVSEEAFYGDESLTEVILPEGLKVIGSKAFRGCSLTSIILPDSIVSIAGDAFDDPGTIEVIANEGSYAYQWASDNHYIVPAGEITISYETVTVTIPYSSEYVDAPNWPEGEEMVVTAGQNGEKEVVYQIKKDKNGNEISRAVYSETITKDAVSEVVYRGTFIPVVTYTYVAVPDLPECDPDRRDAALDEACAEWAMSMAIDNNVFHSGLGHGESVGAWGSIEGVVYGRDYTVISTQNGQTYSGNVSLGSHGGGLLSTGRIWGAGCVIRSETQPDGSVADVYFACARSEL